MTAQLTLFAAEARPQVGEATAELLARRWRSYIEAPTGAPYSPGRWRAHLEANPPTTCRPWTTRRGWSAFWKSRSRRQLTHEAARWDHLPVLAVGGALGLLAVSTVVLATAPRRTVGPRRAVDLDFRFSLSVRPTAVPEGRRPVGPPLTGAGWANSPPTLPPTPGNTTPEIRPAAGPLGKTRSVLPPQPRDGAW